MFAIGLFWQFCKEIVAVPHKNYEQNYQQSLKKKQQAGKFSSAYTLICHTCLLLGLKKTFEELNVLYKISLHGK